MRFFKLITDLSNVGKRTVLWENPSPNTEFASKTIALDLSDADEIEIWTRISSTYSHTEMHRFLYENGTNGILHATTTNISNNSYGYICCREFTLSDTSIVFADGVTQATTGPKAVDNTKQKPVKIVKIKY